MAHALHEISYQDLFKAHDANTPHKLNVSSKEKVIILSDCHLHARINQKVFEQLKQVISSADVLVINGDFWDDAHVTFETFINSKWNKLFPLMRKKTYYIFGNHDMPLLSDERISLFSSWAGFRLKLRAGEVRLHIEHGHLLSGPLVRRVLIIFQGRPRLLSLLTFPLAVTEKIARFIALKSGSSFLNKINTEFKGSRLSVSDQAEYFVMGHTHVPEFDEKAKYVNSGLTHNGHFHYIEVYQNKIHLNA